MSTQLQGFDEYLQRQRAKAAAKRRAIGDMSEGGILKHASDDRWAFILPDMSEAGHWRVQYFDLRGFSGHGTYATAELGMNAGTVRTVLRYYKRKEKDARVRVDRYEPVRGRGGRQQPVYVSRRGPNAPKPKTDTKKAHAEGNARHREAHRARINAYFRLRRRKSLVASPWAGLI